MIAQQHHAEHNQACGTDYQHHRMNRGQDESQAHRIDVHMTIQNLAHGIEDGNHHNRQCGESVQQHDRAIDARQNR